MTIELHIWGPAFGLPSIDARCLAAIAYLRECLPSDKWRLVPSSGTADNPLGELPALRDGQRWVAGFSNIVEYLRSTSDEATDLDEHLSASDAAECIAHTSFIQSRGQPLLDLSLYLSTENYTNCTKPALALLLHWPESWFVPHRLRESARKRSEHLGLSGLDVDTAQDEKQELGLAAQIPQSLRKPKHTVSALLGHDTRRSKFRLDAVTSDFFEPLDELLGEGPWLIGDRPTSTDCLAVGYLAIMQASATEGQPWLRDALSQKHPNLAEWSQTRRQEWFGKAVSTLSISAGHVLPWQQPAGQTAKRIANSLALNVMGAVPMLRMYLTPITIKTEPGRTSNEKYDEKQKAIARVRDRTLYQSQVLASTLSASMLAGILFYNGILRVPDMRHTTPSRNFGTAGDFLGLR